MAKLIFKRGTVVSIYQKPVTGEWPEGKAELVTCLRSAEPGRPMERWKVRFVNEPGALYEREISTELHVHGGH